jgi:hypothetical protein
MDYKVFNLDVFLFRINEAVINRIIQVTYIFTINFTNQDIGCIIGKIISVVYENTCNCEDFLAKCKTVDLTFSKPIYSLDFDGIY